MAEEWLDGTIEAIDDVMVTLRLDNGERKYFTAGECYRDGTSFSYLCAGDRAKTEAKRGGISAPNSHRWSTHA